MPDTALDPYQPATDLAALLRSRAVSAREVARAHLDRLDAVGGAVNAVVWIDRDDVLRRADAADARLADGTARPFEGVPLPVKDLTPVAGQLLTLGSAAVEEVPTASDVVVDLLEDAGFVLFGRTNSPEFGALTVTENRRWGATRNPWDLGRSAGGSSGGAAAAVAAGLASVAHASDGGGSIRVPSAATGLVGLKPSRGRVPTDVRGWEHSVTDGAVTRTVADAAALLDVLGRPDPLGWYSAPAPRRPWAAEVGAPGPRLRFGLLLAAPTGVEVDPVCVAAARRLADALEHLGHTVAPVAPFLFSPEALGGFADVVISASVWAASADLDADRVGELEGYVRYRRGRAEALHAGRYAQLAERLQRETRRVVAQWGGEFDVLLTPTTACATPPVGLVRDEGNDDPGGPRLTELRTVSFTSFANVAGLPALTLPVHADDGGVPVGAQLVGGPFDEAALLRVAAEVEPAFRWQDRHPDLP